MRVIRIAEQKLAPKPFIQMLYSSHYGLVIFHPAPPTKNRFSLELFHSIGAIFCCLNASMLADWLCIKALLMASMCKCVASSHKPRAFSNAIQININLSNPSQFAARQLYLYMVKCIVIVWEMCVFSVLRSNLMMPNSMRSLQLFFHMANVKCMARALSKPKCFMINYDSHSRFCSRVQLIECALAKTTRETAYTVITAMHENRCYTGERKLIPAKWPRTKQMRSNNCVAIETAIYSIDRIHTRQITWAVFG